MGTITELLPANAVLLSVTATEKVAAIRELAGPLLVDGTINNEKGFFEAILKRENLESTGIGLGVALPHARTPAVTRTALAFGRSDKGVDFNSLDGKPATLIFLIAAPEEMKTEYIMTLARVSKLLRRDDVRAALQEARTPDDVLSILRQHEQ